MKKRIVATMLTVSMVAGLVAGCGSNSSVSSGSDSSNAGKTQDAAEAADSKSTTQAPVSDGDTVEFSVYGSIWDPYKETSDVLDKWQEETNTKINFEWAQSDSFDTQLAAKVASQQLPDVIIVQSGNAQELIEEGAIIPITEYLEKDCPNFMSMFSDDDMIYVRNQDGEIYGLGFVMDNRAALSTAIRTDWLENLGLDQPTTWDEWVNVWKAFKEQDANGNGDTTDEIPLAISYANFFELESIFGINSNGKFSIEDGKYIYDPENPKYEAFLDGMRELYADGILYKEYITCDDSQLSTIGANNTLGTMVNWAEQAKVLSLGAREIDEDALFSCITPITGPNGDAAIPARQKFQQTTFFTQAAVESGNIDRILQAFDYLYSEAGVNLTNYGIEGQTYEVVDGKPQVQAPYNTDFATARSYGLIPTIIPFCFLKDSYMQYLLGGQTYDDLDETGKSFVDGLNINDDYYYDKAPNFTTEAYVEYADLLDQQISLRDQYIMGKISKDKYNTEYQALKDAGLQEVIDQAQAAYEAVTK